jgi:hypothetical protein
LHGVKLASERGNYRSGKWQFDRARASSVYRQILQAIDFVPDNVGRGAPRSEGTIRAHPNRSCSLRSPSANEDAVQRA